MIGKGWLINSTDGKMRGGASALLVTRVTFGQGTCTLYYHSSVEYRRTTVPVLHSVCWNTLLLLPCLLAAFKGVNDPASQSLLPP